MEQTLNKKTQGGFTLVELSIVLVIIGLIIGGVLVGQDLIKAAEIRAQVNQIQQFDAAKNTFEAKYSYIPGDIPTAVATSFGIGTNQQDPAGNYTGNGVVNDLNATPGNRWEGEVFNFWVHLSNAALIPGGPLGTIPAMKIGKGYIYEASRTADPTTGTGALLHWALVPCNAAGLNCTTPGTPDANVNVIFGPFLTPLQMFGIDGKMDDGQPNTGIVRAFNGGGVSGALTIDTGTLACRTGGTAYNVAVENNECAGTVRAQ